MSEETLSVFGMENPVNEASSELASSAIYSFLAKYTIGSTEKINEQDMQIVGIALKVRADASREKSSQNNRIKTMIQLGTAGTTSKEERAQWMQIAIPNMPAVTVIKPDQ